MLRFLSERRAWVVAAFVALVLVIGLWMWGAPRATARASNLIGERLGVDAHISEAHLSLAGVELVGAEMRRRYRGFLVPIAQVDALRSKDLPVETGTFRAMMLVQSVVDGPVTIQIDSRKLY